MLDFSAIESLFRKFFKQYRNVLSEKDLGEISRFFDAGEYGLALDTAVEIFGESGRPVDEEFIEIIEKLASAMDLPAAEYSIRLRKLGDELG